MTASSTTRIRVVIVDDHPIVRAGLKGVLSAQPDFEVVGEAGSAEEATRLTRDLQPDIVVMDLVLQRGGMSGIEATATITREVPTARVLVLTTYDLAEDVVRAVEAGAAGYLLKTVSQLELVAAIRTTVAGETVLAPAAAQALLQRTRSPEARGALSPRESEVLGLVALGLSNVDIASRLFITEATVKTHLVRAFGKLEVKDRTAAVVVAITRGLLTQD